MPVYRRQWATLLLAIAVWISGAAAASAQSTLVTSGTIAPYWDGSLTSFTLDGPDSHIVAEFYNGENTGPLPVGSVADLSTTITLNCCMRPKAFNVTIHGTLYQSVWLKGQLRLSADPFTVPPPPQPGPSFTSLSAAFTLSGELSGYSDSSFTTQVFSTTLSGRGVAQFAWTTFQNGSYVASGGGGTWYVFTTDVDFPWTSTDIGAVGRSGNGGTAGQSYYVGGSGADIWGTADAFHFVATAMSGDTDLSACVIRQQYANPYAKAGVMMRLGLEPDSPHVIIDVKPDTSVEFMTRSTRGGETTYLAGTPGVTANICVRLTRVGSTVTGSVSTDIGSTWGAIGSTTLSGDGYAGLAVTSHDDGEVNQAQFSNVGLRAADNPPLPSPWQHEDIGSVGVSGSAKYASGTFAVSGAGADIWDKADAFQFVHQTLSGSGEITALVQPDASAQSYAKAGLMIRDGRDPGAPHVILDVKPDGGVEFMTRSIAGDVTSFIGGGFTVPLPARLKLVRTAQQGASYITAFVSDGTGTWASVGGVSLTLPADAMVGLAVTSHDTTRTMTGTFSAVSVIGDRLTGGNFEMYAAPALGPPGWVSDTPKRQVAAVSATTQPHSGSVHGQCAPASGQDCGMYQDVTALTAGTYVYTVYATADRSGGLVGIDVNGVSVASAPVETRGYGTYGEPYRISVTVNAGDAIRVWMYAAGATVVIDDASLVQDLN